MRNELTDIQNKGVRDNMYNIDLYIKKNETLLALSTLIGLFRKIYGIFLNPFYFIAVVILLQCKLFPNALLFLSKV